MRRSTQSQIFFAVPVFQVVPGLAAGAGEVGNFILGISVDCQKFHRVQIHIGLCLIAGEVCRFAACEQGGSLLNL